MNQKLVTFFWQDLANWLGKWYETPLSSTLESMTGLRTNQHSELTVCNMWKMCPTAWRSMMRYVRCDVYALGNCRQWREKTINNNCVIVSIFPSLPSGQTVKRGRQTEGCIIILLPFWWFENNLIKKIIFLQPCRELSPPQSRWMPQ